MIRAARTRGAAPSVPSIIEDGTMNARLVSSTGREVEVVAGERPLEEVPIERQRRTHPLPEC